CTDMKAFWESKTVWINGLSMLAAIVGMFSTSNLFTPQQVGYLVLALGIINLVLRFITKEPIGVSPSVPPDALTATVSSAPVSQVNPPPTN
ncbi:MAG: hypothetical protein KGL39_47190, partial [Patescibacteria group bacterium]|nr:hypothetical protein [Patescibacteria group bacterium]